MRERYDFKIRIEHNVKAVMSYLIHVHMNIHIELLKCITRIPDRARIHLTFRQALLHSTP